MESQDSIEKRKHKRFRVKERAFVEFSVNPIKVGEMIDISVGGLSFRYLGNGECSEKTFDIKIYFPEGGFISEEINFRTASDFEIRPEFFPAITKIRRRGGCFENLNQSQKSQIEQFIQNHTIGEA